MTVTAQPSKFTYVGNGVTVDFAYPAPVSSEAHLGVYVIINGAGDETPLTLGTDYSVDVANDNSNATVTCVTPPAVGAEVVLLRKTPAEQKREFGDTEYIDLEQHERAHDDAALRDQELEDKISRAITPTGEGSASPFDAGGRRVRNVADPVDEQDLVTFGSSKATLAATVAARDAAQGYRDESDANKRQTARDKDTTRYFASYTNANKTATAADVVSTNANAASANQAKLDAQSARDAAQGYRDESEANKTAIERIALTPGPPGPQGIEGAKGETGAQGARGPRGVPGGISGAAITGNLDTKFDAGTFGWRESTIGKPQTYGQGISIVSEGTTHNNRDNWITQLGFDAAHSDAGADPSGVGAFFRTKVNNNPWSAWHQLWHNHNDGAGSGLDADTLDDLHARQFLRADTDTTLDAGQTTVLTVRSDDNGHSLIRAIGDVQGTGAVEVGQSSSYGGGFCYNGDGAPVFVPGETHDCITFYRKRHGVRHEVFRYPLGNDTVIFKVAPKVGDTPVATTGYDAIGSYVFANNNNGGEVKPGATVAGSSLYPTNAYGASVVGANRAFSGTWRCMGYKRGPRTDWTGEGESTLWVRIA